MNPLKAVDLFLRPRRFFSREEIYNASAIQLLCAWLVGMSATADQIDKKLFTAQATGKVNSVAKLAGESWDQYWTVLAGFGIVAGLFAWFIGGWWYKKRLEFSGALSIDPSRSRKAYVYQSLVYDIPALCLTAIYTVNFPNYLTAWQSDEIWSIFVVFPFLALSCWVSFVAATTSFSVSGWKAVLWFLALPIAFYILAFGAISHIFRFAS